MRRLGTIKEADKAREFSYFLQAEGIVHQVESTQEGSSFWVINEDDTIVANQWMEAFEQDPDNPMFYGHLREARRVEDLIAEEAEAQQAREFELRPERPGYPKAASTPITIGILFFCTLLFMLGQFSLSPGTNFGPTIRKTFLYDYPKQQQLFDALSEKTGIQKIKSASELSPEETDLYKEVLATPRWRGVYPWILEKAEGKKGKSALGTPFERIRQGEVWRFVTPVFLHAGLFHIFFNMLWLIALGSQMEIRIGAFRYVAFIIVAAAVSNTAQYLVSGPNFIGISGVVCGMAAFVWVRQSLAPWEGYNLPPATWYLLLFFVFLMLGLQMLSFFMEVYGAGPLGSGIANTAHIIGGSTGLVLARLPFFTWRK